MTNPRYQKCPHCEKKFITRVAFTIEDLDELRAQLMNYRYGTTVRTKPFPPTKWDRLYEVVKKFNRIANTPITFRRKEE
jgi:hypothetical protein